MNKIAVIGNPVVRSLSPLMHNAAFRHLGLDYSYGRVELALGGLGGFCEMARDEYAGFNVTVPFKTEIIKYLDTISPEAEFAESVNTVAVENGKLRGYSTD